MYERRNLMKKEMKSEIKPKNKTKILSEEMSILVLEDFSSKLKPLSISVNFSVTNIYLLVRDSKHFCLSTSKSKFEIYTFPSNFSLTSAIYSEKYLKTKDCFEILPCD